MIEETHYYPFGLTMSGISSKAAGGIENKKKYNGIEFDEDLDIDTYEALYRNLDPQTGRWWQIDPKVEGQESLSPYNSMANDPIRYSDPLGDVPDDGGPGDPPGAFARLGNAVSGFLNELGDRAKMNIAKDVEWVKNTASSLGENAKANWAAGNTIPQQFVKDALANPISLISGKAEVNVAKVALGIEIKEVETVTRAMSKLELKATESTNLVRGGREGTHYVSDAIGNDAKRVTQRLVLKDIPDVKVTMEVPKGSFSKATKVGSTKTMPGGGMERTATGNIHAKIIKVKELKNTGKN